MLQILILGLIHDSIFNLPLGLSSFTWITWHWFLAKQHRQLLKASIPILWGTFAGTLFILNVIEYIILVKSKLAVSQTYFIFETLIQIGFFPIITHFFHLYLFRLGKFK